MPYSSLPLLALLACSGPAEHTDVPTDTDEPTVPPGPPCDPIVTTSTDFPVEGVPFEVAIDCTTAAQAGFSIELIGPPDLAIDPDTWIVAIDPGLDAAGPLELLVELRQIEATSGVPETIIHTEWIADAGPDVPGNIPPDPLVYEEEFGLPVMHCDPDGPISDVDVGGHCTYMGTEHTVAMRFSAQAVPGYPKNSFTLAFLDDQLDLRDENMNRKEHIDLISTFDDNSYARQMLVLDVWNDIEQYWDIDRLTPRAFYTVLYLDGAYHGLYLMMDRIDAEFADQMGLSRDGHLFQAVSDDANFGPRDASDTPKSTPHQGYVKLSGLPLTDFSTLDALVTSVALATPSEFAAIADTQLDMHEFMDWFHLVTYMAAGSSAAKNAYLYYDPLDPVAPLWRVVPTDFEHSLGQLATTERVPHTAYSDYRNQNRIFAHMQDDLGLQDRLWTRFDAMTALDGPLHPDNLTGHLDKYYEDIEMSAQRDWAKWGADYQNHADWSALRSGDWTTYDEERAYLYSWVGQRHDFMITTRP